MRALTSNVLKHHKTGKGLSSGTRVFLVSLALMTPFVLSGCDFVDKLRGMFDDPVQKSVNALDDAINTLANNSSAWQTVLDDTIAELTDDAQATVRNEVAAVASRSIAQGGVEVRCDADFIGDRVRQALIRIKAKLLKQPIPTVKPALCQVVPIALDRESIPSNVKQLEFYGYDFDHASNLRVFIERTVGGRVDVSDLLTRPTHYAMTLPFGATGVQLNDRSKRIVLEWEGDEISTIAIIQPTTPVCESKTVRFTPGKITYMPPHTNGDKDFGGNGPSIVAKLQLHIQPQKLSASMYMKARETKKDWTEASGTKWFDLWTPDPGWRIDDVVGSHSNYHSYIDSDHQMDTFQLGTGGPARRFDFVGDTDGDDAGRRTQVDVSFNEMRIGLTKTADCVPDSAVSSLRAKGAIRSSVYERLKPGVILERERRGLVAPLPSR